MHMQNKLKITEIFHSIQGESTLSGERTSFVRLTGCPLRCSYCDTTYSFTGGEWMSVEEIVDVVRNHETKYVCITGGEPLSQKNCFDLVIALKRLKINISIETSGEKDVSAFLGNVKIVMDIKTPSSGEKTELCFENLAYLLSSDEIKFVISNRADYEWSKNICEKYDLVNRFKVLFSPVYNVLDLKTASEWILEDRLNVRLQTQLHKHIWGEEIRGV